MKKFYENVALAYFIIATLALMLLAFALLATAVWDMVRSVGGPFLLDTTLDSIGLMIIGFAIIETAKFIAEEEVLRQRELRSAAESRSSLTKFITIIVIAASLEALVMVFKASQENIAYAVYPAFLFGAAMLALVALGAYQWLSSRINPLAPDAEVADDLADGRPDAGED